jgi:hypothetical protein
MLIFSCIVLPIILFIIGLDPALFFYSYDVTSNYLDTGTGYEYEDNSGYVLARGAPGIDMPPGQGVGPPGPSGQFGTREPRIDPDPMTIAGILSDDDEYWEDESIVDKHYRENVLRRVEEYTVVDSRNVGNPTTPLLGGMQINESHAVSVHARPRFADRHILPQLVKDTQFNNFKPSSQSPLTSLFKTNPPSRILSSVPISNTSATPLVTNSSSNIIVDTPSVLNTNPAGTTSTLPVTTGLTSPTDTNASTNVVHNPTNTAINTNIANCNTELEQNLLKPKEHTKEMSDLLDIVEKEQDRLAKEREAQNKLADIAREQAKAALNLIEGTESEERPSRKRTFEDSNNNTSNTYDLRSKRRKIN